jgi:N utilization substance protein A
MVVNELRGEKIDIVPFSEDPVDFVKKALSPAKVNDVLIDEETGTATVIVPDYQLSLAIGKEGQNARLAARMTGWRVDIKSETQIAEEAAYADVDWAEGEWIVDEGSGEQVWRPAEGGPAVSADEWVEAAVEESGDAAADGEDAVVVDEAPAAADGEDAVVVDEAPAEAEVSADVVVDEAPADEDVAPEVVA